MRGENETRGRTEFQRFNTKDKTSIFESLRENEERGKGHPRRGIGEKKVRPGSVKRKSTTTGPQGIEEFKVPRQKGTGCRTIKKKESSGKKKKRGSSSATGDGNFSCTRVNCLSRREWGKGERETQSELSRRGSANRSVKPSGGGEAH